MRKLIAVGVLALGAWAETATALDSALYEVRSTGCLKADITYWNNGGIQQEKDISLPWYKAVAGEIGSPLSLVAQAKCDGINTNIHTFIWSGNHVKDTENKGIYAVATSTAILEKLPRYKVIKPGVVGIAYVSLSPEKASNDVDGLQIENVKGAYHIANGNNTLILRDRDVYAELNGQRTKLAAPPFRQFKDIDFMVVPASALRLLGCTLDTSYLPLLLPIKCNETNGFTDSHPIIWQNIR